MTVRCQFCQQTYKAESGRSECPHCQRAQHHTSLANLVLPASPLARAAVLVIAAFVAIVVLGMILNAS